MKYGFIGLGNMASAIISGMTGHGIAGWDIYGFNRGAEKGRRLAESCGIIVTDTVEETVNRADVVVLAVKPQMLPEVLKKIAQQVGKKLVVSIAAGKDIAYLESYLPDAPIVRVMPNINAVVGSSTSGICGSRLATKEHLGVVRALFETVGTVSEVPETLFAVFSAIAGASPAFTYMYIDALARAAVKEGMPRAQALQVAASAVLGSAKMVLESDTHPVELADRVCSPGGTTIEGVCALREYAFEAAVHEAVAAVVQKDRSLSEQK